MIPMWSRMFVLAAAVLIGQFSCPSPLFAATRSPAKSVASYASALATADHFLQSWQTGDIEGGMILLTNHVKEKIARTALEEFFSAAPLAYEVTRGKQIRRGCYEFPVVLLGRLSKDS